MRVHGTHPIGCEGSKGSKGSEDSEGSEGVVAADAASFIKRGAAGSAGCVEGLWKKVLKMDGPSAQGFVSLTALWAEGCGGGFAANFKDFIQTGAFYQLKGTILQPSAAKPLSNLRTLGAIAPSNFRTLTPIRACP